LVKFDIPNFTLKYNGVIVVFLQEWLSFFEAVSGIDTKLEFLVVSPSPHGWSYKGLGRNDSYTRQCWLDNENQQQGIKFYSKILKLN
jgi:hypothetical protein